MKNKRKLSLYVHIPFCVRKCNYCDFLSFKGNLEEKELYQQALCQEIESLSSVQKNHYKIETIFFGGGTPSILEAKQLEQILALIRKSFLIDVDAEITIEMNPGTVTKEKLKIYREIGINRLSIGLQTTDDNRLKQLGRIHTYQQFLDNYCWARELGFDNISVDLMSALPEESLKQYQLDLERIVALDPDHISSYSLILEEGTPFYSNKMIQKLLPDEEEERAMYDLTQTFLEEYGYNRYEISNYSKIGKESRHNKVYWTGEEYLGVGLGASSYLWADSPFLTSWKEQYNWRAVHDLNDVKYGVRFHHTAQWKDYLLKPDIPCEKRFDFIELNKKDAMEEFMFLGLRLCRGISVKEFYNQFQIELGEVYGEVIHKFLGMQMLEWRKEGDEIWLALTKKGIDVSNSIFCEFLL